MKFKSLMSACVISSAMVLSSCGGGGSDGDPTIVPVELTGKFIDSPVSGLRYFAGNKTGITDADGNFKYFAGDNISFYVGDVLIGDYQAPAVSIMTPMSVIKGATDLTPAVINVARILQSLHDDSGPIVNGISISPTIAIAAKGFSGAVDYSKDTFTVDAVALLLALSTKVNSATGSSINLGLTSFAVANSHLVNTLRAQRAGNYSGTYSGTQGTSGKWGIIVGSLGNITLGCLDEIASKSISGVVTASGNASLATATGSANGAIFVGNFAINGSVTGTWVDSTPSSATGIFAGNKTTKAISCN